MNQVERCFQSNLPQLGWKKKKKKKKVIQPNPCGSSWNLDQVGTTGWTFLFILKKKLSIRTTTTSSITRALDIFQKF